MCFTIFHERPGQSCQLADGVPKRSAPRSVLLIPQHEDPISRDNSVRDTKIVRLNYERRFGDVLSFCHLVVLVAAAAPIVISNLYLLFRMCTP